MHVCHNCGKQDHIRADYSESLPKSRPISNHLPANNAATNLSTTSISISNLSTSQQPIQTPLQNPTQMTSENPRPRITQNWRSVIVVYQPIPSFSNQLLGSQQWNLGTSFTQNPNSQNYLSLLVTPEDATTNNSEFNPPQTTLTNNILPAMITENESLAAIFPFKLEETINPSLFSEAALKEKLITAIYTDAKVDGHSIKLILDSGSAGSIITRQLMDQLSHQVDCTASTRIITANRATKTPIGKINDFPIEVNDIIIPIKILVMEATQYQALVGNYWLSKTNIILDWNTQELQLSQNGQHTQKKQREEPTWEATIDAWTDNNQSEMPPILDWEEKNKEKGKGREENILEETTTTEEITSGWEREYSCEPIKEPPYIPLKCKDCEKKLSSMGAWVNDMTTQKDKASGTMNHVLLAVNNYSMKKCGITFLVEKKCVTLRANTQSSSNKIWQMVNVKVEGTLPSKILEIKNNPPEPTDIVLVLNPDAFIDLENSPEEFHKHYQNLTPIREEQKQCLEEINTQLCDYCLIPCNFQFCDDCNLIYNPPPHMIYTISEEKKPINSCASKSKLSSNPDLNSDNNDNENNSSSSIQYNYNNDNNSNSDSNFDLNYEQYIALPDLTKKQELK
ncbi:hypothetical protein G9A89_021282 [Geosiphon pyriformis]|nr:hypothetical protein G9A89_021282 [Geosiphon pyriformis]